MSAKASSLMKNAQIEKTKQTIQQLIEWYAKKQEFFKIYVPIQQSLIKKIINAPQFTLNRLKQFGTIVSQQRQLQALIFQKSQKHILNDQARFAPRVEQKIDPKDPKGVAKIQVELPSWCNNIDRVLLSMSRSLKERKNKIKQIYKTLETLNSEVTKEQQRYKSEIKSGQKQLQKIFQKFDDCEKQCSKIIGKIIKQSKGDNIKDSAFFVGQIKRIEKSINGQFQHFIQRNKTIVKLIQIIIKNEKVVAKKMKEYLNNYLSYRRDNYGKQTKSQQETWEFLSLTEERIQQERLKYFNSVLLRQQRIDQLKKIVQKSQFKNNWQVIVRFIQTNKTDMMKAISANQEMSKLLKNISYRYWPDISLAQGWLIQSYTPAVLYMTYDYTMLIYNFEGQLIKKINTSCSKVKNTSGQTLFLQEKQKGFFSDNIEEYKIKFQDIQRMEQFQLFIENQIK